MLNDFFDPTGLLSVYIIQIKIKMKVLTSYGSEDDDVELKLGWDDLNANMC